MSLGNKRSKQTQHEINIRGCDVGLKAAEQRTLKEGKRTFGQMTFITQRKNFAFKDFGRYSANISITSSV